MTGRHRVDGVRIPWSAAAIAVLAASILAFVLALTPAPGASPIGVADTGGLPVAGSTAAPSQLPASPTQIPAATTQTHPTPAAPFAAPQEHAATDTAYPVDVQKAETRASSPVHITYPAIGMDQSVLALYPTQQEIASGSIVPPATLDAYWLTPYGTPGPGSTNTTYIVGHSWEDRGSPFNNISSRAKLGDQFTVTTAAGNFAYRVDSIATENKDTLRESPIWDIAPGRLVLITCFTEDLWGKNIILQASPID